MSADNYYFITRHPAGGFTAIMGFASEDSIREVQDSDISFRTLSEAAEWAGQQEAEYGLQFDTEFLAYITTARDVDKAKELAVFLAWVGKEWRRRKTGFKDIDYSAEAADRHWHKVLSKRDREWWLEKAEIWS